jgi:uncharacterized protein involved in outer membrane biogenesis
MSTIQDHEIAPRRSLARRGGRWLSGVILALILLVCAALVAILFFEQLTLRPLAEYVVKQATGRTLLIEGELDLRAGRIISVHAAGIRLANATWGSSEDMLSVDEAQLSLDLLRLFDTVPSIDKLVVSGAKILVEENQQGHSNWALGSAEDRATSTTRGSRGAIPSILNGQLSDIEITVKNPALEQPLEIRLDSVEQSEEQNELYATIAGEINGWPLKLQGHIGPVTQLLDAGEVDFALTAAFEAVTMEASGHLDSLLETRQASAKVSLQSTESSQILTALGVPKLFTGATTLKASLVPSGDHHTLEIASSTAALNFDAKARLDALNSIDAMSVTVSANGPDLAAVAGPSGLDGMPSQPFELKSSLALSGRQLTIGETHFDVGDSHLTASGVMSQFPQLEGSNLNLHLVGKNYLKYAQLLGLKQVADLQPEPFEVRADLKYSARDKQQFTARATLADVSGEFSGKLTAYPDFVGSQLDYRVEGHSDGLIQRLLDRETVIEGAFKLQGDLERTQKGFSIEHAVLSIGANELQVGGTIGEDPLSGDTDLSMQFHGPDLAKIIAITGYTGFVPAGVASISASARAQADGIQVDDLTAQIGANNLNASGLISLQPGASGSRVKLTLAGADIAGVLPLDWHAYVDPQQAFELDGTLALDNGQLGIGDLQAKLGAVSLTASGSISTTQPLTDMSLKVDAHGPDLAAIIPEQLVSYSFPAEKFSVAGAVALTEKGLTLDDVKALVGSDRIQLSGTIPLDTPTDGLHLTINSSGPNLGGIIPLESAQLDFKDLAYQVDGSIQLTQGVLSIRQLDFSTARGQLSGELSISLENPRHFGQFNLMAKGDNFAKFLPPIPNYSPASVPFDIDASGSWDSSRISIEKGKVDLGDSNIEVHGDVTLPPDAMESRLVLTASGDDITNLGQFKEFTIPPDEFSFDASLEGDANGLRIPQLDLHLGDSDLSGSIQLGFAEKMEVKVDLVSDLLDLASVLSSDDSPSAAEPPAEPMNSDGRLIPQMAVPVDQLHKFNLEGQVKLGELRLVYNTLKDIEIDARLQDGNLTVTQLKATAREGQFNAQFLAAADGDRIVTNGKLQGKDIVFGKENAKVEQISVPRQDFKLEFVTSGATIRELAANLNGYAGLRGGAGRLQNSVALGLYGNFFAELISTVNPFVTRKPYTNISCFVAYADIVDGVATINPGGVMQTEMLNIFSRGQINLTTERINLRFDTAARSGIGVSLSDFVNPFVGITGTLSNPSLGVDPENAMFEGGFAYATGGLSIIFKGLFNRWLTSDDPCTRLEEKALKNLERRQVDIEKEVVKQQKSVADK